VRALGEGRAPGVQQVQGPIDKGRARDRPLRNSVFRARHHPYTAVLHKYTKWHTHNVACPLWHVTARWEYCIHRARACKKQRILLT
jgi:hypothetical protein